MLFLQKQQPAVTEVTGGYKDIEGFVSPETKPILGGKKIGENENFYLQIPFPPSLIINKVRKI